MNLFTGIYTKIKFIGLAIAFSLMAYCSLSHACLGGFAHPVEVDCFVPSVTEWIDEGDREASLDLPEEYYREDAQAESQED